MAEEHCQNGTLSGEGDYWDGRRDGPWTFSFRNGRTKATGVCKAGRIDGE
ncbi:hypothetical protein [Streptomyces sp. NPDC057557]